MGVIIFPDLLPVGVIGLCPDWESFVRAFACEVTALLGFPFIAVVHIPRETSGEGSMPENP